MTGRATSNRVARVAAVSTAAGVLIVLLTLFIMAVAVGQWWAYLLFALEGGFVNALGSMTACRLWSAAR